MKKMKKKTLLDSVEVASPCSQDWNRMYGNDEVRFCEHCVKHVHDLSAMTRAKAEKFVARSNGSVCVRYIRRPDGKVQTTSDKLYQISSRASRLAAGVFGATLTLTSTAYTQGGMVGKEGPAGPQFQQNEKAKKEINKEARTGSISGTITDANNAVIPGATAILTDLKTEAERTTVTNDEGIYLFQNVPDGNYRIKFTSVNFRSYEIGNINFKSSIDAEYSVALEVGFTTGDLVIVEYENQLARAVNKRDIERIKTLIARGVNVNEKDGGRGETALQVAVSLADVEMIKLLLGAGAKANIRDDAGRTALMKISDRFDRSDLEEEDDEEIEEAEDSQTEAEEEQLSEEETENRLNEKTSALFTEIFGLLISHGAKVDLRDEEGYTALMYAAQTEYPVLVQLLISHGANVNVQAKDGRTALMEAADSSELENVRILLEAGAKVNLKDDEGDTAFSLAGGDDEVEELLISYGAKRDTDDQDN